MNPRDNMNPVGADSLPSITDIAPAELKSPLSNSPTLETTLDSMNRPRIVSEDDLRYNQPRWYDKFGGRKNMTLVVLVLVFLSAVSFAVGDLGSKNKPGQATDLNTSNFANLNGEGGSVSTNDKTANLTINYNTILTEGRTLTANGQVIVQNDSADGFKVQNAGGDSVLVVDTANQRVGIGQAPTGTARLQVNGNLSVNGNIISTTNSYSLTPQGLSLGGVLVCTSAGCTNQSVDLSGLARLASSNTFTGINRFTSGGNVFNGDGSGLSALDAGNVSSGTLSDSRLSGNVALANGNNNFTGSNSFSAQIQAGGGIDASAYSVNGTPGGSFTCGPTQLLQQAVIQSGVITSGSCVTIAGGTTPDFQTIYDASLPATFTLSNANGGLQIQDASSALAGNLFSVTNNGASTTYFAVNNLGISVTGNVNTTGQYQVGGVQISSANLSNDSNLAKLNGNQTFSGNNTFNGANQLVQLTAGGILPILNGSNLTALNASNVSSGTLNDARLSN
ncbi:hypothetical protein KW792_01745, partial [Candidatus Saccharibacteria bacterium]|nr:hypothetical protein [Candidatus Saccharibacteria bacterium]